jgi:hypothetical protein
VAEGVQLHAEALPLAELDDLTLVHGQSDCPNEVYA